MIKLKHKHKNKGGNMGEKPIQVNSEIGKLKTVILHRPGKELEGLTPEYLEQLLFDDIPYLEVAQAEHDAFAETLRSRGIEVLYLDQLAAESLYNDEIKWRFISDFVRASKQGERHVTHALMRYLGEFEPLDLVRKLMSGVKKDEIRTEEDEKTHLNYYFKSNYPFLLDPMPNLYFTRDPAAAVGNGLTINKMRYPARRRESLFMEYIMRYHPRFAAKPPGGEVPVWFDRYNKFNMEGGDELVLSRNVMAIGVSQRTTPEAIEKVASKLFEFSDFNKILAIQIPVSHAFMHLDTVFTMIDRDKFTVHPEILDKDGELNIYILEDSGIPGQPKITHRTNLKETLEEVLGLDHVTLIQCGNGDPIAAAREQWNDGSNTLAIAPGVVVTYDRNYVTNKALREAGVEVIEIQGAELGRGRGGPRCMSMPIWREEI